VPHDLNVLCATLIGEIDKVMRELWQLGRNGDQNSVTRFQAKTYRDRYIRVSTKLLI